LNDKNNYYIGLSNLLDHFSFFFSFLFKTFKAYWRERISNIVHTICFRFGLPIVIEKDIHPRESDVN